MLYFVIVLVVFVSNCGCTIYFCHAHVSRSELQNFLIDELTAKVCIHKTIIDFHIKNIRYVAMVIMMVLTVSLKYSDG